MTDKNIPTNVLDNEVYQDADGCLYTPLTSLFGAVWYAMGCETPIDVENNPLVAHPLTKVVEADGTIVVGRLNYAD